VNAGDLKREGGVPLTHPAHSCASDRAKKSAQPTNTTVVLNVAAKTTASSHDLLHIRVSRDANSSVVLDDMPGDARLIGVVIETQQLRNLP
jgi:hypothetical protein